MGHNNVVSGYPKSIRISWVDELSIGPPSFGVSHSRFSNSQKLIGRELKLVYLLRATSRCKKNKKTKKTKSGRVFSYTGSS